jgi:hypothetical protein
MEQAAAVDDYGWYQYHTAEDPKVRPHHAALNGLVIKFGSPEGDRVYPPNGYQCRCWTQLLNEEQARSRRTRSEAETRAIIKANPPDSGFEGSPVQGYDLEDPAIIQRLRDYDIQTVSDKQFKEMMENALNYPESGHNLRELGRVIPRSIYDAAVMRTEAFREALLERPWEPGEPIDVRRMTRKQWESLTEEQRLQVQADNPLLSVPLREHADEVNRVREVMRRAEALGVRTEEELSRLGIVYNDILKGEEYSSLKQIKDVARESNRSLLKIINKNLSTYPGDKEMLNSLKAMDYLTPGERYAIADQMNARHFCGILNKKIRKAYPDKHPFIKLRDESYTSLDNLGLIEKKQLFRGVKILSNKKNLLNKTEDLGMLLDKAYKAHKDDKFEPFNMEFSGGSYPWSSNKFVPKKFIGKGGKDKVIFKITTKNGIPGQVLSRFRDHEYTITPGMQVKVVSVTKKNNLYIVQCEEVINKKDIMYVFSDKFRSRQG